MTQKYPELGFLTCGGHIQSPRQALEDFTLGESLGMGSAWVSERPGSKDIGVLCGVGAGASSKVSIGSNLISNLPIRNPLTVASFASTMMLMTENKFILGVGHGQNSLADMVGAPHSTRPIIGRYIDVLRRLWRGEAVTESQDNWTLRDATLGVELEKSPPIYMAGVGDKSLAWAGEHCDGALLFSCLNPDAVRHSVDIVKTAAERAGRDPSTVKVMAVAVTACDASEEQLLNYVVRRMCTYFMIPNVNTMLSKLNRWDSHVVAEVEKAVLEQATGSKGALGDEGVSREMDDLRRIRDLMPVEWIDRCNAVGDAESCCRWVRSLLEAGADGVIFHGSPPAQLGSLVEAWPRHRPAIADLCD